ncbi:MAG TPA: hypothetical protein VF737_12285 [Gemmatimonadaceae bacterium]
MTQDDIDRLIADRRLARQVFDDGQIAGFWSKAITAFADAQVDDISLDTALQTAYRACLQAAFAVLAVKDLRVKSTGAHFIAFYAMRKLDESALGPIAVQFDALRAARSESVYEPDEDEPELARQLTNAGRALEHGLPVLRAWIVRARPGLAGLLRAPSR